MIKLSANSIKKQHSVPKNLMADMKHMVNDSMLSPKTESKTRMSFVTSSLQHCSENAVGAKTKDVNSIKMEKIEKKKASTGDMIICN